jgi:broad specificity phosphatase PhoE
LSASGRPRVVVVRHGETEWSASGRHTSSTDLPLTDDGRRRAEGLAGALSEWTFAVVLSSPLRRARETSEIAGFGSRAELDDDLREWGYGEYEGLTTPEIWERDPDWSLWRDGCPGGEQPSEVAARADRVLARLAAADGDGLVFAHGHLLRVLAARWVSLEAASGARLALGAGAISVLGHERDTRVIERWNEVPGG